MYTQEEEKTIRQLKVAVVALIISTATFIYLVIYLHGSGKEIPAPEYTKQYFSGVDIRFIDAECLPEGKDVITRLVNVSCTLGTYEYVNQTDVITIAIKNSRKLVIHSIAHEIGHMKEKYMLPEEHLQWNEVWERGAYTEYGEESVSEDFADYYANRFIRNLTIGFVPMDIVFMSLKVRDIHEPRWDNDNIRESIVERVEARAPHT